jgi:mRNA interferase MazF
VTSEKNVVRGEIWWSTVDERRPVVILSTHGEEVRAIVVVPAFQRTPHAVPRSDRVVHGGMEEIQVDEEDGLTPAGVVRVAFPQPGVTPCQWLVTLPMHDLHERAGALSTNKLAELERLLRRAGLAAY